MSRRQSPADPTLLIPIGHAVDWYQLAGWARAGQPVPPAWQGMGGDLDEVSRAARGTVYRRRQRRRSFVRRLLDAIRGIGGRRAPRPAGEVGCVPRLPRRA